MTDTPVLTRAHQDQDALSLVRVRRLIDDLETPISAFLKLGWQETNAFLFESVEGGAWRGRYSILTLWPDLVWRAFGERAEIARGEAAIAENRFEPESDDSLTSLRRLYRDSAFDLPSDLPPMAAGLFGVFGYDMVRLVEPLGVANPDPLGLPDAILTRPSVVAVFDSIAQEILLCAPVRPGPGEDVKRAADRAEALLDRAETRLRAESPKKPQPVPLSKPVTFSSAVSEATYGEWVNRAKGYITAGDIFQVVPSHRFESDYDRDAFAFYRALRRLNPSPFLFYLNFGPFQLAGSSPEILVRLREGKVTIRPIAGTRPRGATPEQDQALEQDLLADPKERSEHLMLLDLGRNDVGRVAKAGTVKVTEQFVVERYSHVMHIVSNVEGEARADLDPIDALLAALPAGTLSGAPKVRAMEIIDELEPVKRGLGYAGGVGYISANGQADIAIVLRTALIKDGKIHVQAGAGVVADSDPRAEYEETCHKAKALMRAAQESWRF